MDIKFLEILPKTGRVIEVLFEFGDRDIKIGVTHTFRSIYNIRTEKEVESFLKQFGELVIRKMLSENNLFNYIFKADDYSEYKDLEKIKEKLENDILNAEEKRNSIGFKAS